MRSPRRTRDARHASELRIYRQTPAKRFWNFFWIFVSVQFENSAKAPSPRGIPRETKQGYILTLLTFFLPFFLTYLRLAFGQAYEEEEEWQSARRADNRAKRRRRRRREVKEESKRVAFLERGHSGSRSQTKASPSRRPEITAAALPCAQGNSPGDCLY